MPTIVQCQVLLAIGRGPRSENVGSRISTEIPAFNKRFLGMHLALSDCIFSSAISSNALQAVRCIEMHWPVATNNFLHLPV